MQGAQHFKAGVYDRYESGKLYFVQGACSGAALYCAVAAYRDNLCASCGNAKGGAFYASVHRNTDNDHTYCHGGCADFADAADPFFGCIRNCAPEHQKE